MRKGDRRLERSKTLGGEALSSSGRMAVLAHQLLQLELELENKCTKDLVVALVEQYQQAIELCEQMGDPHYLDLQARMQKMFLRSDVQQALGYLPPVKEEPAESIPAPEVDVTVSRSMTKLLESQANSTKSTAAQVQKDKVLQDEQLRARLLQRSSRHRSRRTSPSGRRRLALDLQLVDESQYVYPLSAQASPHGSSTTGSSEAGEGLFDDLELKLEEFMERNYAQRSQRLAEIREKYEPELRELESQSSSLMKQVAEQTRAALEKELAETSRQLDEARKTEIRLLRQQFLGLSLY